MFCKCAAKVLLLLLLGVQQQLQLVNGHGMMLQPPGRSSRWRTNGNAPHNYNDNGLNCGGFGSQWSVHGGKCGFCGDDYALARPRPNELGGKFGDGTRVAQYQSGATVTVGVQITANHLGHIQFELCNLDAFNGIESDACYAQYRLRFDDGSVERKIGTTTGLIQAAVRLPAGVSCGHCVLRWTYVAGNNWGYCPDGKGAMGCGPQEHFRSCADISIRGSRELVEQPLD